MSEEQPDDLSKIDQEIRINKLKNEVHDLTNGEMVQESLPEDLPLDLQEQFWEHVANYEKAPLTTDAEKLASNGVDLPPPEDLDDEEIKAKLWELIQRLAQMRTFLTNTDHLSDRQLYQQLWKESLREEHPDIPVTVNGAWTIDILGNGSEADAFLYLKYYADEKTRKRWAEDFPEAPLPPHENLPYDRDRFLPQPHLQNPE
jgi:hypothetical protein